MNPLFQAIQEALKPTNSDIKAPGYTPGPVAKTTPLVTPKQVSDTVGPVFHAVVKGLDAVSEGMFAPARTLIGAGLQLKEAVEKRSLTPIKKGTTYEVPKTLGELGGLFAERALGPDAKPYGNLLGSLAEPPYGAKSLAFLGLAPGIIRVAKDAEIIKFAEEAAKITNSAEIARKAEQYFHGIPRETAERLGKLYEAETDASKIAKDLTTAKGVLKERGFVSSVKRELPEIGKKITDGTYTTRPTEPLAVAAQNLIRSNPELALTRALRESSDESIALASELLKGFDAHALSLEKQGRIAESNALRDQAAELTNQVAKNLTEGGKFIQAATILSKRTPEGIARFIAKEIQRGNEGVRVGKQVPELTGENRAALMEDWKRIQGLTDPDAKAEAVKKFMDRVQGLLPPSPVSQQLITAWKAGLLTGIRTSGLNLMSNAVHGFAEIVKDIPAAIVERGTYAVTGGKFGKPTIAVTTRGLPSGSYEGLKKGFRYLKTGYNERNIIEKFDINRVNFGTSKIAKGIQMYEESIFRFIGSQDMPFYYGAKARSIVSQAIAKGKSLKLRGQDLKKYVDGLLENPEDDMLRYAAYDAEIAVFQNTTALAKFGQAIQRGGGWVGQLIMPFVRTPASVAMQVINYSPVGVVSEIVRQIQRGSFDQRLFSQGIGRAITGTAVGYLGTELYKHGLISLAYPDSTSERNQWELEGRVPYSIKVHGKWRSAAVLGPPGLSLLMGGQLMKGYEDTGTVTGGMLQATASLGNTLTEQTFLKGTNELNNVLNDPYANSVSYFGGILGSLIPTFVSDVARASDPFERRANEGPAGGLFARLYSRIPGVREQQLQPKVTSLGNKVPTPEWWETMVDPSRPSKISKDPVVLELRRMQDAGWNATPTKLGTTKKGYASLTPQQNTDLWITAGTLLHDKLSGLVALPEYKQLSDEMKQKAIQQFSEIAKRETRAQFIFSLTSGLSGADLKKKLVQFKADKLLTEEVFKAYLRFNPNLQ